MSMLSNDVAGKITIVCLGPLTNLAVALRIDTTFGTKLRQCTIMGGNTQGNSRVRVCMCLITSATMKCNHVFGISSASLSFVNRITRRVLKERFSPREQLC